MWGATSLGPPYWPQVGGLGQWPSEQQVGLGLCTPIRDESTWEKSRLYASARWVTISTLFPPRPSLFYAPTGPCSALLQLKYAPPEQTHFSPSPPFSFLPFPPAPPLAHSGPGQARAADRRRRSGPGPPVSPRQPHRRAAQAPPRRARRSRGCSSSSSSSSSNTISIIIIIIVIVIVISINSGRRASSSY